MRSLPLSTLLPLRDGACHRAASTQLLDSHRCGALFASERGVSALQLSHKFTVQSPPMPASDALVRSDAAEHAGMWS